MFIDKTRQSIRFRFLGIITGILIVSTVMVSTIIAMNEKRMLLNSLITKGESFGSYIAKLSQDPLVMKDAIQLDALVNEANQDEDIMYAVIRDIKGNIVTSQYASINYRSRILKPILPGLPRESGIQEIVDAIRSKEAVAELSAQILSGDIPVGKVTIGISESKVRRQILMTILFVVALNLAVAFALGAVLFIVSKKIILDPITELAHATVSLAEGDLGIQVKARTTGEVQMLVDSFNRMAEELAKRSGELVEVQEELVRKEKLAMLGRLSGSVGHELRNPLGVMSNAVYLLKMLLTGADEKVREYLGMLEQEINTSRRIITDLLDFARTKPPQQASVAIPDLVGQSLGKCDIPGNVTVNLDLPEMQPARTDPLQMGQVLLNLITNAVQAMPDGGELRVAARRREPDADFVEISVEDTGEGIAPENMKMLFQPLFTTKARGIGLGLVVCRNLVEANGGRIDVESRVGEGTTFTVTLPVGSEE